MTHGKPMNNRMTNESNELESRDIDWLAFQYLTDELSADEVARFEACLSVDQLAREALARAVELTHAVAVVESTACDVMACEVTPCDMERQASGRTRATWVPYSAWLAVAALALVAFILFGRPQGPPSIQNPGGQSVASHDVGADEGVALNSGELAVFWVSTAEFLLGTELVGESESFDRMFDDDLLEPLGEPTGGEGVDIQKLQAPSWMMAALAGSAAVEMQE